MANITPPKYAFIDCETTGLDPNKNAIIQLHCIIRDHERNEIARWHQEFMPHDGAVLDPTALKVNGKTEEELTGASLTRPASEDAFASFVAFLEEHVNQYDKTDKLIFAAYNAPFDEGFVRSWFDRNSHSYFGSFFWNPSLCIMNFAMAYFADARPAFPRFNLQTLCELNKLGWDDQAAHDAAYDNEMAIKLYDHIVGSI